MEADLFVLCRCVDEGQRQSFHRILDEGTRALLEEHADESERKILKALEDTDFPEYLENVGSNRLYVHWWLGSRFTLGEIPADVATLLSAGAEVVDALLYVDGEPQALISAIPHKSKMHLFNESPVEGKLKPCNDDPGNLIDYLMQP